MKKVFRDILISLGMTAGALGTVMLVSLALLWFATQYGWAAAGVLPGAFIFL